MNENCYSVGIWTLSEAKLQAAQAHQTWKSPSELIEGVSKVNSEPTPILIATPGNFNPDFQLRPVLPKPIKRGVR
ncbi:hypothetical protein GNF10_27825 [Nostoc sp. UCD121]|uniref:hypothetical protein n=1 Tax=unclassified Nostoc TaxID=2593658 RepID=UPI00162638A6|nr:MULTISPECIES: hypothetical protein [unclassified Nostoc]MBC1219493.1 hypothetical protein [Nostoc sp. UCD120]MBC1279663.1 hypothetical protein [Nostoc sp. UCD121]MBC1298821.1 hypothetical protein [Nostoc sp. UCD122]